MEGGEESGQVGLTKTEFEDKKESQMKMCGLEQLENENENQEFFSRALLVRPALQTPLLNHRETWVFSFCFSSLLVIVRRRN